MKYLIVFALVFIGCKKIEQPTPIEPTPTPIKHKLVLEVTPHGIPFELYLSTVTDKKRISYAEKINTKTIKQVELEKGNGIDFTLKWGTNQIPASPYVIYKVIQDDSLNLLIDTSYIPMTSERVLIW
jgi:hypothetical protein